MSRSAALSLVLLCSAPAAAQEGSGFSAERLRPAMDARGIIDIESGAVGSYMASDVALWLGWARNPVVLYRRDNGDLERAGALVQDRTGGHLVASFSLYPVQVGFTLPLTFYQDRGASGAVRGAGELSAAAVGDIQIAPKLQLLHADSAGADVALLASLTIPSGLPEESYAGESSVSFIPEIAATYPARQMRVGANLGYRMRENSELLDLEVGDEILYRFGAALALEDLIAAPVEVGISLSGATAAASPFSRFNTNPLELMGQAAYALPMSLQAFIGAGAGLVAGYGTPDLRLFGGVRYAPTTLDYDADGIEDSADACRWAREDVDGFEDEDGCPDGDNDQDGVDDDDDRCNGQVEDKDGFEDDDGCPEPDNDGDKKLDAEDECPNTAGDEANGCPKHVTVSGAKLEFAERVYFDIGKASIEARSLPLLDEVATVLEGNPQITRLRIEGHTDSEGEAEDNRYLSQDRADAVRRYLMKKGVAAERLEAVGYGEAKPLVSNDTEAGRSRNRRVEFVIVEGSAGD